MRREREPFFHAGEGMKLPPAETGLAEALANFGMGVLREGVQDPYAISNYLKAVELAPEGILPYVSIAGYHVKTGEAERAIAVMKECCERNPDHAKAHLYLAQVCQMLGRLDKAEKAALRAVSIAPHESDAYLRLSSIYSAKEDRLRALTILEKSLGKVDDTLSSLRHLGDFHAQSIYSAQPEQAPEHLRQAIDYYRRASEFAFDELSPVYLSRLGDLYMMNQDFEQAILTFEQMALHKPRDAEVHKKLALCFMAASDKENAMRSLKKVAEIEPDNAEVHYYLGLLRHRAGLYSEAVQSYEKVERLARRLPGDLLDAEFFFHYGAACERIGDHERAEAMFVKSITLDPNNAQALNYLAYMWAELDTNLDTALDYVTHALDIEPHNGAYIDTLGWIYYRKGEYDLALDYIANALYFMPDDPVIAEHMGDILRAIGREEESLEWWIYSFRLDSTSTNVQERLLQRGVDLEELLHETQPFADEIH